MKSLTTTIVLFIMTLSSFVYGQDKEDELPSSFIGEWAETLSQCEVSSVLSISMWNNQLSVYAYELIWDEVKVKNNNEYYTLLLKVFSEGEEYESEMNIKIEEDGNLIVINSKSEEIKLIRCNGEDSVGESFDIGLLQGKWQSIDDESNFLIFENNLKKENVGGLDDWDEEIFLVSEKCLNEFNIDDDFNKEKNRYISCPQSDLCWYIDTLDSDTLILEYLARGNLLTYKRVK